MADAPWLIMVFNNVGNKAHIPDLSLRLKYAVPVIIRCDLFAFVPALPAESKNSRSKVKHAGEITILTDELGKFPGFLIKHFAHCKSIMGAKGSIPQFCQKIAHPHCLMQHVMYIGEAILPVHRIVMERKCFFYVNNSVNAETSQSFIQPPVDHAVDLLPALRVLPVQIRLFPMKQMHIVFVLMSRQFLPGRPAEIGTPVVGTLSVFCCLNIEKFPILSIGVFACLPEPLMFVRAMVYHQIHHHMHISLLRLLQQFVHILHRTEAGIDIIIIRNIIALIRKR